MSKQHSLSAIKRWANTPVELKKAQGALMATAKWKDKSKKERSAHAKMMSLAKKRKVVK